MTLKSRNLVRCLSMGLALWLGVGCPDNPPTPNDQPPDAPNSPDAPKPNSDDATFAQGLFAGRDPRVTQHGGFYYSVAFVGQVLNIYRSRSLIDWGVGKPLTSGVNGGNIGTTLFSPIYIDTLGGVAYNAWYIFGPSIYKCACQDPYDDAGAWQQTVDLPFTGGFDFEVFRNPQPGRYQGRWYLLYVVAEPSYVETIHAAEILSLTPGHTIIATGPGAANTILSAHLDWSDIIVEAPGVALNGASVSFAYSANGAQTSLYSLGLAILKMGQDPTLPASWLDYSHNGCSGAPHDGPEFAKTADVVGPGVARFVKSADGSEDWMLYHAKIWDTWDRGSNTPEPQQRHNEAWERYICAQRFAWQTVNCDGQSYTIPHLGKPVAPGTRLPLPSGDPGSTAKSSPFKVEAESMIPFGAVMGPSIQGVAAGNNPISNQAFRDDVRNGIGTAYSNQVKIVRIAALAADQPTLPRQSGLIFRNAPPGSGVVLASASLTAASFDLYIDGAFNQTLALPATGSPNTFAEISFRAHIPRGSEIKIVYEHGKSAAADLDYIKILPN